MHTRRCWPCDYELCRGAARINGADAVLFVGNQAGLKGDRVVQRTGQPVLQSGQAFVFVDAAGGPVADRDDANANTVQGGRRA